MNKACMNKAKAREPSVSDTVTRGPIEVRVKIFDEKQVQLIFLESDARRLQHGSIECGYI